MTSNSLVVLLGCAAASLSPSLLLAHDGPPFPIVSDRRAGAYTISIWTDPDTTDDGAAGGQFWIVLATGEGTVPAGTYATVTATPLAQPGEPRSARTALSGNASSQYVGLVLDHEGRYAVQVTIDGPLGRAAIDSEVTATYDLRPAPFVIVLSIVPFVLVGLLWTKLLMRRRKAAAKSSLRTAPQQPSSQEHS